MTALLRMTVFAMSFTIRVKLKLEDMVREVFFTKHYLEHSQRVDLWYALLGKREGHIYEYLQVWAV